MSRKRKKKNNSEIVEAMEIIEPKVFKIDNFERKIDIKKSYIEKLGLKCNPECIYYPNSNCESGEWKYDEDKFCNVRKNPKVFKCLYDNQPIDWHRDCPREIDKE